MRALIKSWQATASKNALNNLTLMNGGGGLGSLGGLGDINMGDGGLGGAGGNEGGFHGSGNTGGEGFEQDRKIKMEPTDDIMEVPVSRYNYYKIKVRPFRSVLQTEDSETALNQSNC